MIFVKTLWALYFCHNLRPKLINFIVIKFGLLSAENRLPLHAVFGRGITVRILLLIFLYGIPSQNSKKVCHCFLAQTVQKLKTFQWRSSEFLNIKYVWFEPNWDHGNNSLVDKNFDKSTHRWRHLWFAKTYFCLIYGTTYIPKYPWLSKISIRNI